MLNRNHFAMDANFRLNNRAHGQKNVHGPLGAGFAHMVDPDVVNSVVKKSVTTQEVYSLLAS
jgi:hypothetical protein